MNALTLRLRNGHSTSLVLALLASAGCSDGASSPAPVESTHEAEVADGASRASSSTVADDSDAPSSEARTDTVASSAASSHSSAHAWKFAPNVAISALDQNNTSACGSDAAPCSGAWSQTHTIKYSSTDTKTVTGFWDNDVAGGASAPSSSYGAVSKVPVSALLPGYKVPVWVAAQDWWGQSGHIDNGETSSNATQVENQVADQLSRGFSGQVVAWDGPGKTEDKALGLIKASAEASKGAYGFAARLEKNYLDDNCSPATVDCLNAGIKYLMSTYGSSTAYLKDRSGKPVLFVFIDPESSDFKLLSDPGVDTYGGVLEMVAPHGFPGDDPPNTAGEYAWVNPTDNGKKTTSTTGSGGTFTTSTDFGFSDQTSFFKNAASNQSSFLVASVYKGFDDNLATWSENRIVDQRCGQTWLETFDHTGTFAGGDYTSALNYLETGKRLDMVMVNTWDDYEEGTEIETGIDNCMKSFGVALSGETLTLTTAWGEDPMDSSVTGSDSTLYKYSVYIAEQGGSEAMWLEDVPCTNGACPSTIDLSNFGITGGPYVFYVVAVGQPTIVNHLAGPTTKPYSAK